MPSIRIGAVLAALALGVTACAGGSSGGSAGLSPGSGSSPTADATPSTVAGLAANLHGQADVTGKSTVTVQAENYYFEPSVLKGTAGQKLTLHVVNATSTAHNITVAPQHVNSDLDGHGAVDVAVTLPASGVLSFWCEYHKARGMVGGLLVSGSVAGAAPAPAGSSTSSGGGYYGGGH
jgi:plastocyanin